MAASDKNWPLVVGKLWKARKGWAHLTRILIREVAIPRVSGMFLKVVVQVVLIYRSEMWIMNFCIVWSLGGFQHRVARIITGRQPQR